MYIYGPKFFQCIHVTHGYFAPLIINVGVMR